MIDGQLRKCDVDNTVRRVELRGHDLELSFHKLHAKLELLTWMVGFNLAATMAVLCTLAR